MAKDEFIGIRVSKEFKKFIQGEAKRKGMSLSEYIEYHSDDNFKLTKKHFQDLMERTKEDLPIFWNETEKSQITKAFEEFIPDMLTDFLNPLNHTNPALHPSFMLMYLPRIVGSTVVHVDSIEDLHKRQAVFYILSAGKYIAENLNKMKVEDKEKQKDIISEMRDLIESFAYSFTSMAFERESFLKIKAELDKVEKILHKDIEGKGKK